MGIIIAIALFIAVAAAVRVIDARRDYAPELLEGPKRAPRPGARDTHTVTGMLGHAAVPQWG
jgi:hypothetical protein